MSARHIPGLEKRPKGWAVRPLKWHASWVQNVVRQFGLYLLWASRLEGNRHQYERTVPDGHSGEPVVAPAAPPGSRVRAG